MLETYFPLLVTYYGVEKTIEKEFEVFKNQGGTSGSSGAGAGGCAHVSPFSCSNSGSADHKESRIQQVWRENVCSGNDDDDDVDEYTLTCAYCIGHSIICRLF